MHEPPNPRDARETATTYSTIVVSPVTRDSEGEEFDNLQEVKPAD